MASQSVINAIDSVAAKYGVNPQLAQAIAQQESGLNPYAVGDNGTSFGLYQLHQGGELGNLTPQQAFNPTTNANVALGQLAATIKANPNITDPGTLAAMAQRPANPAAYAASIDGILNGSVPVGGAGSVSSGGSSFSAGTPILTSSTASSGSIPILSVPLLGGISISKAVLVRGIILVMGLFLLYAGVKDLFGTGSVVDIVQSGGSDVKDKATKVGKAAAEGAAE